MRFKTPTGWMRATTLAAALLIALPHALLAQSQPLDSSRVVARVDAAVRDRFDHVAGYTVQEHYAVYRGGDEIHAVAEMTVKTSYSRETGKSYQVLSESGSDLVRHFGLHALLDQEKSINLPENREHFWFTSANYQMTPQPGTAQMDGRECIVLAVDPRRTGASLIKGNLWVDARDGAIVRVEGVSSKSPSVLTSNSHVMRQYESQQGYSMATHARAETNILFIGPVTMTVDYSDYQMQLAGTR